MRFVPSCMQQFASSEIWYILCCYILVSLVCLAIMMDTQVIQPFSLHGSDYGLCGQIMDILQPSVCTMISSILAQIGLSGFHQGCFYILAMSEDIVEEMHALLFELLCLKANKRSNGHMLYLFYGGFSPYLDM